MVPRMPCMNLRFISAADIDRALDDRELIRRLGDMFKAGCEVPLRHHHPIAGEGGEAGGTLLLMPAWQRGGPLGVKSVSVYPGNAARGLPSVLGIYLLFDGSTGEPRAVLDGVQLTLRRTAAASALAASFLASPEAKTLLMVGAGALAPHLIRNHCKIRGIERVVVWNRNFERAQRLAASLQASPVPVVATEDLETAARGADIISCATLSQTPLIQGEWLKDGAHLDLVGSYTASMRECDDCAVRRARLFVDTREGALKEAGDIVDPLGRGVIAAADIQADLHDLCQGRHGGRRTPGEITLFKSVGTALEDLAAAALVVERSC
jgi:alanine dehydrogenase